MQTLWQDIKDKLAMLDPTAKILDLMLINRILHTLTHEEFVRLNNTCDAILAKEQAIGRLTELLRLMNVCIEQHSNDDDNFAALQFLQATKGFLIRQHISQVGTKDFLFLIRQHTSKVRDVLYVKALIISLKTVWILGVEHVLKSLKRIVQTKQQI